MLPGEGVAFDGTGVAPTRLDASPDLAQSRRQLLSTLEPAIPLLTQGLRDDPHEADRRARGTGQDCGRMSQLSCLNSLENIPLRERLAPGHHLIENSPGAEDIRPLIAQHANQLFG